MRAVIQRVSEACVQVESKLVSEIKKGLLIYLGIEEMDNDEDIEWLSSKIVQMRIFPDSSNLMNQHILDQKGDILLISQFTLFASTKKGNRPSFIRAAKPEIAIPLYENMIKALNLKLGKPIETGIFGADMQVSYINDGPVTIIIDTKNKE
ncbi:MAG: D-aminoacyl-tRNA deacylase [Bacteroidota bacterium]